MPTLNISLRFILNIYVLALSGLSLFKNSSLGRPLKWKLYLAMRKGDSSALSVIHLLLLCMMLPLRTTIINGDVILRGESLPTSLSPI